MLTYLIEENLIEENLLVCGELTDVNTNLTLVDYVDISEFIYPLSYLSHATRMLRAHATRMLALFREKPCHVFILLVFIDPP